MTPTSSSSSSTPTRSAPPSLVAAFLAFTFAATVLGGFGWYREGGFLLVRGGPREDPHGPNTKKKKKTTKLVVVGGGGGGAGGGGSGNSTLRSNRTSSPTTAAASPSPGSTTTLHGESSSSSSSSLADRDAPPGGTIVPDAELCDRTQIRDGRWLPVRLPKPPYLPPANKTGCAPYEAYLSSAGWDTYAWLPRDADPSSNSTFINHNGSTTTTMSCQFTAWDADRFCQIARYATVLIVGDSLSWEHYVSLVMLLGVPIHHGYQDRSRLRNVNIGHAVCNGHTRIVYRRDDDLSKLSHALNDTSESNATLPQIVVLNRGAHYAADDAFMAGVRSALDVVETWLGTCQQMNLTCHFFWRTTVPGHANCRAFKGPVNDLAYMEAYVSNRSNYDAKTRAYHWQDFRHQNELAEAELERRHRQGRLTKYRVLDGYRLNILRPDSHTDCLHSCNPGKMDVYPQLMLHYLTGDRTLEDVQRLKDVFHERHWYLNVSTVFGHS